MSQEAILKITKAEEQAEVLCRVASERAAESRADMQKKASEHLALVESAAIERNKQKLAQSRAQAQALVEKKRAEAKAQAAALSARAEERMEAAVKAIVWGIVENVSK